MNGERLSSPYFVWVMRIWQEPDTGNWRAIVSQSPGERQHAFTTKGALIAHLADAITKATVPTTNKLQ